MTREQKLQQLREMRDPQLQMERLLADHAIAEEIFKLGHMVGPAGKDGYVRLMICSMTHPTDI